MFRYWAFAWVCRRLQLRTARQCSMRHTPCMAICQACSTAATRCSMACHQVGSETDAERVGSTAED